MIRPHSSPQRNTEKRRARRRLWVRVFILACLATLGFVAALSNSQPANAAFPGPNGKIVFSKSVGGNEDIYVMNPDGTGVTQLTSDAANDQYPKWSADGTKIVFDSDRDGDFEIFVMNADGSGVSQLTSNTALDAIPSWSPDGTKILFYSNRDGNDEIYVMKANGTGLTNLTNNAASDGGANFSPDGSKIAFFSTRSGYAHIYLMNPDGSSVTQLTSGSYNDGGPNWSPDGSKIAFHSDRVGNPNVDIFTMNANGSSQTQLTSNAGQDTSPAWSPDGTKIAFVSTPGSQEIYVMNANGTGQTNVTGSSDQESSPDWQPLYNIAFNPINSLVQVGNNTIVTISFNGASNLYGYQFEVTYDASKVSASGAFVNTWFDTSINANVPGLWNAVCTAGTCKFAATKVAPGTAVSGFGTVAQITFTGTTAGASPLTFTSDIWSDVDANALVHNKNTATVTVYDTATVSGTVNLQGRATPLDATGTVTLTDPTFTFFPTVVNFGPSNGNYSASVPALAGGTSYNILAAHLLYLSNQYTGLSVTPGGSFTPLPNPTKLLGGDADNSGKIDIGDLGCIGGAFGGSPTVCGVTGSSDINADGAVNILDLVLAGGNYFLQAPQPW